MIPPYRTMFKLPALRKVHGFKSIVPFPLPIRDSVFCVKCDTAFPLSDLLGRELEESQCPSCKTTAEEFWKDKPSLPIPEYN
jgi:hypothetical protein